MNGPTINASRAETAAERAALTIVSSAPDIQLAVDFAQPLPAAQSIVRSRYSVEDQRVLHYWQGEFHHWTGSHYVVFPAPDVRAMLYEEGEQTPGGLKRRQVDDVMDALRAVANLSNTVPSPFWLSHQIDDPPPRAVIPLRNGLLDIVERALLPASPRLFVPYALPFEFDPHARPPARWLLFLAQLWPNDQESVELLQEWFGYVLTADTAQQKALLWIAPKRGGKGTAARVLGALLGAGNIVSPTLASLGTQFGLQPLIGKLLALISDARLGGQSDVAAVAENVLRITGEDSISIPRKYLADYTATLPTRLMVLSNEIPRFTDGSGALPSRFLVLHSTETFYGREDHSLTDKLMAELPGILNWALDGLERLRARGRFHQPQSALEVVDQMDTLAAPVQAFLADTCDTSEPTAETNVKTMFAAWRNWCEANGRDHPGTTQTFGRDLRAALPGLDIVQHRGAGKPERYYVGVAIRSEAQ